MCFSVMGWFQITFFIQLHIEIFLFVGMSLPIPLSVQLVQCIQSVCQKVPYYRCIVISFSMSFFKSGWNSQIFFLFQFVQPFCFRRPCLRPISNSSYGCSVPYTTQHARSLIQFLFLLCDNSCPKLIYSFLFSASCNQIFKVLLLLYPSINFLIFKLNTAFIQNRRSYSFPELVVLELASYTYLFAFKLSLCSFPLVFVYYRCLSLPYYFL